MTKRDKEVLNSLSKEQLIYLIEQLNNSMVLISEICVEESKLHVTSVKVIEDIRKCIYALHTLYDETETSAYIDMERGKISRHEYRNIVLNL
jgi:hypothetical protein